MKCDKCNDEIVFIIHNLRKHEEMKFCSLHFWHFCKKMDEYFNLFKESIPEIKRMLENIE